MKLILTEQQYKLLLKEAKIPTMKEVLGDSIDTFKERFAHSAVELQNLIADIFGNKENYTEKNGNIFLISASGGEISFESFKNYIQDIVNGKSVFDLQKKFPKELKGKNQNDEYIPVRVKVVEILSNPKESPEQSSEESEYPLSRIGKSYKEFIETSNKWLQITEPEEGDFSGWKLHIYSTTPDEVAYIYQEIYAIAKSAKVGVKLASISQLNNNKGTEQEGKGVSLYLPYSMIRDNKQGEFVKNINNAISNLKTGGTVSGDNSITPKISYRYEFGTTPLPVLLNGDFQKGLTYDDYKKYYTENSGNYNPAPNNPDIFQSSYYYRKSKS